MARASGLMMEGDLEVSCYAGYRGEERPLRFRLAGRTIEVTSVRRAWREPEHRIFEVSGDDGRTYRLRHDERLDRWTLLPERRSLRAGRMPWVRDRVDYR